MMFSPPSCAIEGIHREFPLGTSAIVPCWYVHGNVEQTASGDPERRNSYQRTPETTPATPGSTEWETTSDSWSTSFRYASRNMRRSASESSVRGLFGCGIQLAPPQAALAGAIGIFACRVRDVFAALAKSTFIRKRYIPSGCTEVKMPGAPAGGGANPSRSAGRWPPSEASSITCQVAPASPASILVRSIAPNKAALKTKSPVASEKPWAET